MRSSTFARLSTAQLLPLACAVLLAGVVVASPRDRKFFSVRHGVGVEAPPGWTLSQHTGYPSILVALLHPDGSRISISAAPTPERDGRALADQNRRGLETQKLSVTRVAPGPRGGTLVEARAASRDEVMRQLYLVRPFGGDARQAVVLTLVTRSDHLAAAMPGFDWAIAHLDLEPPPGREGQGVDGGAAARP